MGTGRTRFVAASHAAGLLILLTLGPGCQSGPAVSSRRLIEHQALIDFSGLKPAEPVVAVRTTLSAPRHWDRLVAKSSPLYTIEQWRSPSSHSGVGVVYAHLPLPLSATAVVWLAKHEYAKKSNNGKVLGEWIDALGRAWFEAENDRYHVRGYVVVEGFDAWVVFFGYRANYPPDLAEISLAARSAETAVPRLDASAAPTTQPVAKVE